MIDTNVLIAANRRDTHASLPCAAASARVLLDAQAGIVLEDTADMVLTEYKRYAHMSGQPGPGDLFLAWFMQNRATPDRVQRVDIGNDQAKVSSLVPAALQGFDRSDHKWVALYLAGSGDVVFNATDSDWAQWSDEMIANGIVVHEICDS